MKVRCPVSSMNGGAKNISGKILYKIFDFRFFTLHL